MRGMVRPALLIFLALMVPILPWLSFGAELEAKITAWFDPPPAASTVLLFTVGVLASDIVLPVPSSLISTIAAAQVGFLPATGASWLGMTLGAVAGFWLARTWGRSLALRLSSAEDLERMDQLGQRYGAGILIITRAVPVFAEAAVLLMGTTQLPWRRFLPAIALSNLGLAAVYAAVGRLAEDYGKLPVAIGASIALPVLAATMARRWLR